MDVKKKISAVYYQHFTTLAQNYYHITHAKKVIIYWAAQNTSHDTYN
jgi:hypothetical protein